MIARLLLATAFVLSLPAQGQSSDPLRASGIASFSLDLDEAVQIALERNYLVRTAKLDTRSADAQVREAWGQVKPYVSASGSYTRNVVSANPFAGTDAGGIFGALGAVDWLAFNESARTDGDPETQPISLEEFRRRQADGFAAAGVTIDPAANPFGVPNQFQTGISITQTLYSGAAFAAIRGAQGLRDIHEAALVQQQHLVVHETRQLFYGALLAQRQAEVTRAAVDRAADTYTEAARLVAAGTLPLLERMSAEVEVTNLETQLLQARNQADAAKSQLLFHLGLPVDAPVTLTGSLDVATAATAETVSVEDAMQVAMRHRPELEQARLAIHLQQVNRSIVRAQGLPVVSAFANLNYLGNVPDQRSIAVQGQDPDDPFRVAVTQRRFFDGAYWSPSVAVGAQFTWTLFDGFQTRYRVQQHQVEVEQAQIHLEQVEQLVRLEVDQALRNVASARQRITAQAQNVERAEATYQFASTRLSTGVASQLDVRMASGQLDQARLHYLQAAFDFLVARSELERAIGRPALEAPIPSPIITTAAD